jgi:hypothetical protein
MYFVTKRGRCIGILVLSPNCQRGDLLVLVLANSEFKTGVPKQLNPSISCLDAKPKEHQLFTDECQILYI